jgi:hypothetical protein
VRKSQTFNFKKSPFQVVLICLGLLLTFSDHANANYHVIVAEQIQEWQRATGTLSPNDLERRSTMKKMVGLCSQSLSEDFEFQIEKNAKHLCKKATSSNPEDVFRRGPVSFRLLKRKNSPERLTILYKIRFEFSKDLWDVTTQEMMKNVSSCLPLMKEVWSRYQIDLDLTLDSDRDPSPGAADQVIDFQYARGHSYSASPETSNKGKLFYFSEKEGTKSNLCSVLLHESGHHLGLFDEYDSPECPDRPIPKTDLSRSIMRNPYNAHASVDFLPLHLKEILGNYCTREVEDF